MSSRSGGLLELVARGKKDIFFTSNPQSSFFHSVYTRCAPFSKEIYIGKPRNNPEWGRYVDFDIEHRGDILHRSYLRIQLPTWLPMELRGINETGVITDMSGVSYGYTNEVGFFMLIKYSTLMIMCFYVNRLEHIWIGVLNRPMNSAQLEYTLTKSVIAERQV